MIVGSGLFRCVYETTWEHWKSTIWTTGLMIGVGHGRTDITERYFYCLPDQEPSSDMPIQGKVAIYFKMWTMFQNNPIFYVTDDNAIFTRGINGCIRPKYFDRAVYLPEIYDLAVG